MTQNIDPTTMVSFPPLPASVIHLTDLISHGSQNFEEITHVIELDPILTASVLRWSNSSWSSAQVEINNIWDAVVRLGAENVLKLAVGHHMMANMRKLCGKSDLSEDRLWKHSVSTGLAIDSIRTVSRVPIPHIAFTAAIMHDMGKVIIARQLGYQETNSAVSDYIEKYRTDEQTAEKEVTGMDHVAMGSVIAEQWNLPTSVCRVIADHHCPDENPDRLVDVIALANTVSQSIGFTSYSQNGSQPVSEQVLERLEMDRSMLDQICKLTLEAYEKTAEKWGCR